jgi:sugar phosphate permease
MLFAALGAGLSLAWLNSLGAVPIKLFAALFAVHFFNNALITLTVGPVCSETVPSKLMATASGMVIAAGELFGGGLAPIVAGEVADNFGIAHLLWLPMAAMGLGFILCMLVRETHTPPPLTVDRELWIPLP